MKFKQNYFHSIIQTEEMKQSNGKKYTIRENRNRYFYPDEWMAFYDVLKERQKLTFNFLINTGARINEIRNIIISDVDFGRNCIILKWTKARNKDGTRKIRVIPISNQFKKYLNRIITEKKLLPNNTFGLLSTPASNIAMKNALQRIGIPDWKMLSVHNVRKTLETWLIALDTDSLKVSKHFGHSIVIASKHYVSPDSFSFEDKQQMRAIIGDLYQK